MKNLFSKRNFKAGEIVPNLSEFMQINERIIRGVFWGISVVALILSMVNLRENVEISKTTTEIVKNNEAAQDSLKTVETNENSAITYSDLDKVVSTQLGESVSEYVSDYISNYVVENKINKNFDEESIAKMQGDIATDLVEKLKDVTTINDKQELVVKELVTSMISQIDIEKVDYDKIDSSIEKQVTKLVNEKAQIIAADKYDDTSLKNLIATNEKNILKNSQEIDKQDSKISEAEKEIKSQTEKISDNSLSIASNKSKSDTNELKIAANTKQNDIQDEKITNTESGISSNSKKIDDNAGSINNNKKGISKNADNINSNSLGIKNNSKEIQVNTEKIEKNQNDISNLNGKLVSNTGESFQFWYENGVYGYKVNDVFYPF